MSEKEKNILDKLFDTVPTLDKEKQNYLVGLAEGMALAREQQGSNQLQEAS